MKLSELPKGQKAEIVGIADHGAFSRRLMDMGFVTGRQVTSLLEAPLSDPIKYSILDYEVSLRRSEAALVEVEAAAGKTAARKRRLRCPTGCDGCSLCSSSLLQDAQAVGAASIEGDGRTLRVALVGNPNCGKTSLFNIVSGARERVGNYGGVTVESKTGHYSYKGFRMLLTDLPGTYALDSYSPEERYVAGHLESSAPDVVVNVVDSTNLERNLFLTTELLERRVPTVIALNMYDELRSSGASIDCDALGRALGVAVVPVVAKTGEGMGALFDAVCRTAAGVSSEPTPDPSGRRLEAEERYAFVERLLEQAYSPGDKDTRRITRRIDSIVTSRLWGFPVFLLLMAGVFWATFAVGQYPMDWIEASMEWLGGRVSAALPDGWTKDLLVDGVIAGVGSVIVFLPNILILYLCLSVMEDSGYMARAAFIMDKLMHKIGIHGKSFIPLVMGFGCNVPAIMATRTIESRSSRLITILVNPFMSCSARLPVVVLLVGTFFPAHPALVFLGLYLSGIVVAVLTSLLLRRVAFKKETTPFVMELPPYRRPALKSVLRHTWAKGEQYLRKMGTIILAAGIAVWALNYFPLDSHDNPDSDSYLEMAGKAVNPVMEPLGFHWRATVAALAGLPAKEIVVSTLGVLYASDEEADEESLGEALRTPDPKTGIPDFTAPVALSFLLFVLLYCPCLAAITAVARECGSWKYGAFSVVYNTLAAWVVAFAVYRIALLL